MRQAVSFFDVARDRGWGQLVRTGDGGWLAGVVIAFAAAGCGSVSEPSGMVPVQGRLVWGGRPLAGARVVLQPSGSPASSAFSKSGYPRGTTDANGDFFVSTRTAGDGAPGGNYALLVIWPLVDLAHEPGTEPSFDVSGSDDQFGGSFATLAGSPRRITVHGPRIELGTIDLAAGATRH